MNKIIAIILLHGLKKDIRRWMFLRVSEIDERRRARVKAGKFRTALGLKGLMSMHDRALAELHVDLCALDMPLPEYAYSYFKSEPGVNYAWCSQGFFFKDLIKFFRLFVLFLMKRSYILQF